MRPDSIIKYDFMGSWRSTISEKIRVGFTTTLPKGFLLGFYSNISQEYMTIMISNSGKFTFDEYDLGLLCLFGTSKFKKMLVLTINNIATYKWRIYYHSVFK